LWIRRSMSAGLEGELRPVNQSRYTTPRPTKVREDASGHQERCRPRGESPSAFPGRSPDAWERKPDVRHPACARRHGFPSGGGRYRRLERAPAGLPARSNEAGWASTPEGVRTARAEHSQEPGQEERHPPWLRSRGILRGPPRNSSEPLRASSPVKYTREVPPIALRRNPPRPARSWP